MKKFALIAVALVVAGCENGMDITTTPVLMDFTDQTAATTISGYSNVNVRAWVNADGNKSELQNVPCTLTGTGFSAELATPSVVSIPVYLGIGNTKHVIVSCTYEGETVSVQALPYNDTVQQRASAVQAGFGLVGALITLAASEMGDLTDDVYLYENISVVFEKDAASTAE